MGWLWGEIDGVFENHQTRIIQVLSIVVVALAVAVVILVKADIKQSTFWNHADELQTRQLREMENWERSKTADSLKTIAMLNMAVSVHQILEIDSLERAKGTHDGIER